MPPVQSPRDNNLLDENKHTIAIKIQKSHKM